MFNTTRFLVNILIAGFFIANFVNENAGCVTLLEGHENSYLAHAKLRNLFAGFNEIADKVRRSDTIREKLVDNTKDLFELYLAVKQIESEVKNLEANQLDKTMDELCRESANSLWLKCIQIVILRAAIDFKTLLQPTMSAGEEPLSHYRPRLG